MNYFPFHIGDYAAHTAHLEPLEDLAYRRLIDLYYLREEPLPADVQVTAKLVRMRSMAADVESVLREFFTLTDAGWTHQRCDAEIDAMRVKQMANEEKESHEKDRMRRYRERRAEMFQALRDANVVPAWDVSMKELQRLFNETCNAPETRTGPLPETDSQRLSLPTPTPTPVLKTGESAVAPRPKTRKVQLPEDFAPNESGMKAAQEAGIDVPAELQQFRNHHRAKASVMADWQAAWRTWVGHAVQFGRAKTPKPAQAEWAKAAGFESVYEAENAGCRQSSAHLFHDGKREVAT